MPGFEGLFGIQWDGKIQELLFTVCYWHGLAKLRMHSDSTLKLLNIETTGLGNSLRFFTSVICQQFDTFETPAEKAARARAIVRAGNKTGVNTGEVKNQSKDASGPKRRVFNMKTFKIHELGHYVSDIHEFGTTDSYSTQIVGSQMLTIITILIL